MGIPVLVLGASGSGKSASLRNFKEDEVGIFNVAKKPLPFRKKFKYITNTSDYPIIKASLGKNALKRYIVDDSQYLMAFYLFSKVNEMGYTKFTNCAVDFYNLVQYVINNTSDDTIVYFLHHTELTDDGKGVKAKTSGKMLDSQLTLEGLFSIVLMAQTDGGKHFFVTNTDGSNPAKTPMDMFKDIHIDNDLKMVDNEIRKYYEFK